MARLAARGAAALAERGQRFVLRTEQTPLRAVWAYAYSAVICAVAAALARAARGVSVYVRGSLAFDEPVFGLSDIDMIAITSTGDVGQRARVQRTWERLYARVPLLANLVYSWTYDDAELKASTSASCFTYSLEDGRAAFLGNQPVGDDMNLLDRPGPFGPAHGWRLIRGPQRFPQAPPLDAQDARIAAWLELQMWCRLAYAACADPTRPYTAYLCLKLVVEPVRLLLWLTQGEKIDRRDAVLNRALRLLPEEESALHQAIQLRKALPAMPKPPLSEVLPVFLRLSSRLADHLIAATGAHGTSEVLLLGANSDRLVVPLDTVEGLRRLGAEPQTRELVPLLDWRALVVPSRPDETCLPVSGAASDPSFLGAVARAGTGDTHPLLQTGRLQLLPTATAAKYTAASDRSVRWLAFARGKLRAIQCQPTDPVTAALAGGADRACFPNVRGWCALDVARRAVAEHRAWLELDAGRPRPPVRAWLEPQELSTTPVLSSLARLLTAARAALFLQSLELGGGQLALTVEAVVNELATLRHEAGAIAEEAVATYRECRLNGESPERRIVAALRDVVASLDAYAR